ncbi:cytosine deaminase, partial [Streptomyces sp. SolWspMP-sol7th]
RDGPRAARPAGSTGRGGLPAELLAVRGDQLSGALSLAYGRLVVHRGRVVARTSAVREYCDSAAGLDLPRQSRAPRRAH